MVTLPRRHSFFTVVVDVINIFTKSPDTREMRHHKHLPLFLETLLPAPPPQKKMDMCHPPKWMMCAKSQRHKFYLVRRYRQVFSEHLH